MQEVRIERGLDELRAAGEFAKHLLMWEFTRGSGKAVIRNLAQ